MRFVCCEIVDNWNDPLAGYFELVFGFSLNCVNSIIVWMKYLFVRHIIMSVCLFVCSFVCLSVSLCVYLIVLAILSDTLCSGPNF